MKKVRAAVGALACTLGGAALAQSSVTVSGLLDVGLQSGKTPGGKTTTQELPGGMTTSWFGFTGTEDLGNGLKAGFKLTAFVNPNNGTAGNRFPGDTLFSRDAAVSLSGDFGSVVIGRQIDPAFVPTVAFNPFGDSFDYSPLVFHTYLTPNFPTYTAPLFFTDSGWSNAVTYSTPNFGGASGSVSYQLGGQPGKTTQNYGANFLYFSGTLSVAAFYENNELTNPVPVLLSANQDKQKLYGISGAYDLQVVKLFANYYGGKYTASPSSDKIYNVGLAVPLGAGSLMLDYASTKSGQATSVKWNTISLGYDYFLSKRTDVYVNDMNDKVTGLSKGNEFGFGIRHRF